MSGPPEIPLVRPPKRLYLDSETCGLHGMPVLLQYAVEDGPITLYDVWKHPVGETLALIEWMLTHTIVGFNLTFDHFMLCKAYTIFRLCPRDWIPEDHIDEIAHLEPKGQDGPCLKPTGCLDLMLHSRKGPYQALMSRDDVRIRRVPNALAYALAEELEHRIEIDGIFFAKRAKRAAKDAPRWAVFDRKKKGDQFDPDFKDVCLRFSPAGGLKFLAEYALKKTVEFHFEDIEIDRKFLPKELGYAPTALAISERPDWSVRKHTKTGEEIVGHAWPGVIKKHIEHWATNQNARKYAELDIVYTRDLDAHFEHPATEDDDSTLACMVAAVRWHGFTIDIPGIENLLAKAQAVVAASPININKPKEVRRYLYECMDDMEKTCLEESTKKANLEGVSRWQITDEEECSKCEGQGCRRCVGGKLPPGPHPAALRAQELLGVKVAVKEIELYKKLLRARKLHASFKVIGALSSRMSGADGLNAQGVKRGPTVRGMFPLAWDGMQLSLGDFDSFEVTIADAVCNDPDLRHDLQSGKKIHGIFGSMVNPKLTYEEVLDTKNTEDDWYTKGKSGFFATILYCGNAHTLKTKFGVDEKIGQAAIDQLLKRYAKVNEWRQGVFKQFCSMSQPKGIGSQVVWNEPADYCDTLLGFRRYFTLENRICKALFDLARKPPKDWKDCKVKVVRRDRVQTAGGAVASALYGAAFGIQAASMRAAANHQIQSVGAIITKKVQRKVWDLQPVGVQDWKVCPFQVHDEILCIHPPEMSESVKSVVVQNVESFRDQVPLIGMGWQQNARTWADK